MKSLILTLKHKALFKLMAPLIKLVLIALTVKVVSHSEVNEWIKTVTYVAAFSVSAFQFYRLWKGK